MRDLYDHKGVRMQRSTMMRMGAVGAACVLVGGAAGIAGSSASSPKPTKVAGASVPIVEAPGAPFGFGPLADAAGPPVHSDSVVPNDKGGFDTVTMDRGSFASLSGDQLTITEGTKAATYKTVTLTIPSGATVRRNREAAKLSDLKSGDTVMVLQGPQGTVVAAHDAQHPDLLQLKVRALQNGGAPIPLPKPPPIPEEGSSSHPGEGPETGASG
jgi:hypothetical protein